MISYRPLWKTLIDKDIKKTQLMNMVGFSAGTLSRLSKNQYVEMKHIDGICQKLGCRIEDVHAKMVEKVQTDIITRCSILK